MTTRFERLPLQEDYFQKALEKANSFIQDLDPELHVKIAEVEVTPNDPSKEKVAKRVLRFSHESIPNLNWTMEIEQNDEYIENRLEGVVRKVYEKKLEEGNPRMN